MFEIIALLVKVLLALLCRAAQQGAQHLLKTYDFLAAGWKNGDLVDCEELRELREGGIWILAEAGQIVRTLPAHVGREDVKRMCSGGEAEEGLMCSWVAVEGA